MPQYDAIKTGAGRGPFYNFNDVEKFDDIIVSPDKTEIQGIKAYTHEVVTLDPKDYQEIKYTGNDDRAHEFSSLPLFWNRHKDIEK